MARRTRRRRDLDGPAGGQEGDVGAPERAPELVRKLQQGLGNAQFARLVEDEEQRRPPFVLPAAAASLEHRPSLMRSLLGQGVVMRQPAGAALLQRQPVAEEEAPPVELKAEAIIAAKYPHLAPALQPEHYKAIQAIIDWRLHNRSVSQKVEDFKKRQRKQAEREDIPWGSYQYLSSYNDKLERIYKKFRDPPKVTSFEIDVSKLIDRKILDQPKWNIEAEKEFRESWVLALTSKPAKVYLMGDYAIEDGFQGIYWNGHALPNEGGLITWEALMRIPGAFSDYNKRVLHSPAALIARESIKKLKSLYSDAESEYDFERERKAEFPIVSRIAEFFSSEIDWNVAKNYLPKGKTLESMGPLELMKFLGSLNEDELKRASRTLPSFDEVLQVYKHLLSAESMVDLGKYEAALLTMPQVADEIEVMYRRTLAYRQRTVEGAASVVTGLQYVRTACNIVLTVGGGVAGKAYGLVGISAGSAAGAGVGTFTQETAMQIVEGKVDPGSILAKTGKDVVLTFVGSMIGGALGSKFASFLGPRLATAIPNEAVRSFVIGRVADAGSGLLTAPLDITVTGMLEGDWPKDMDDLLDRVAKNVATEVVVGGAIDAVTGIPNLKGKAWDELTASDVQQPKAEDTNPMAAGQQAADLAHAKTDSGGKGGGDDGALLIDWGEGPQRISSLGPMESKYAPAISNRAEPVGDIDRTKPMSSGGDPGQTAADPGFGVFKHTVVTEQGLTVDAVIKIFPPGKSQAFAAEVEGARVAAATGVGPPFYGVVEVEAKGGFPAGLAYAQGRVEGHFTSMAPTEKLKKGTPEWQQAEAEAAGAEAAVSAQTVEDVKNYGMALEKLGYATGGDLQGLVSSDGRWTPIDFASVKRLPDDPVERLKVLADHRKWISQLAEEFQDTIKARSQTQGGPGPTASP